MSDQCLCVGEVVGVRTHPRNFVIDSTGHSGRVCGPLYYWGEFVFAPGALPVTQGLELH